MRRYHEEKHIIEKRAQLYKQLGGYLGPQHDHYVPAVGRFRKTLRCSGCGRARCQVCHPDKFPKRKLTRKEQQANKDFRQPLE
jgi:hypothetical protein